MENALTSLTSTEAFTLAIAAYGAIISTFVLGWDAYKWLASGARVDVSARANMMIITGRGDPPSDLHISVTASNTGDRPTTITNLGGEYYESWWAAFVRRKKPTTAFIVSDPAMGQRLPYRFEVGDQWIGMVLQSDDLVRMARGGYLFLIVCTTGRKSKHRTRVTIEQSQRQSDSSGL